METGKDEDGNVLPIFLESLIDSKPALYSYLQIPFFKIFGATTQASRMPSALLGTISIFVFYLLVSKIFKNQRLGLIAALLLAISPWHIMNSRATQEVILSFTFILANLLSARYLNRKYISKKFLLLFIVSVLGAMYVYHAAKIVLVLLYLILAGLSLFDKKRSVSQKKISWGLFGIIFICFVITAQAALTRFSAIGLLNDDLPRALIFDYTTNSTPYTPLILIRAFYNKPVMYFKYFLETYLHHFDLNFLFTVGGATRRFIVPDHGLFYIFELLLMPIGMLGLIKKHPKKLLPWILLLLSPIPAALTTEEIPSSIRAFTMIIPLTIFSAMGIEWLLSNTGKKTKLIFYPVLTGVIIWSVAFFAQQMFVMMPIKNTLHRSRSYEVVSQMIADTHDQYNAVYFASDLREMYIYLWQLGLISIEEIQSQPLARYSESYALGKYNFSQTSCEFNSPIQNSLLVAPYSCASDLSKNYTQLTTANFDDGTPGFVLLTNRKKITNSTN